MPLETREFDPARYLTSDIAIEEYLAASFEDGTPADIANALGVVARARGMTDLAKDTGLSRQALYKALSKEANPEFATILKVVEALGYRLSVVRAGQGRAA